MHHLALAGVDSPFIFMRGLFFFNLFRLEVFCADDVVAIGALWLPLKLNLPFCDRRWLIVWGIHRL